MRKYWAVYIKSMFIPSPPNKKQWIAILNPELEGVLTAENICNQHMVF